uniref:Replication factor A C-terminal domain-containing protein n=1 Tax=Lactuca sativa TaxID=4236 RepID=A0A9R1WNZ3_LACSA|nr:hypothetical protein LSAT_V11C100006490 [Lactuca sativa]
MLISPILLPSQIGLQNPYSSLTVDTSQSYDSEYDEFLINHKVKNVVDLLEPQEYSCIYFNYLFVLYMGFDKILIGTMRRVQTVKRKLMQGIGDTSVVYECYTDKCIKKEISYVPRYKIPIRVQDDSGTITLTLFDKDAYKLVKKRASDLIEKIKQAGDNPRLYPYDLKCLEHKNMAFKVDVNSFKVSNNYNRFGILGYTLDNNIINALEKN